MYIKKPLSAFEHKNINNNTLNHSFYVLNTHLFQHQYESKVKEKRVHLPKYKNGYLPKLNRNYIKK